MSRGSGGLWLHQMLVCVPTEPGGTLSRSHPSEPCLNVPPVTDLIPQCLSRWSTAPCPATSCWFYGTRVCGRGPRSSPIRCSCLTRPSTTPTSRSAAGASRSPECASRQRDSPSAARVAINCYFAALDAFSPPLAALILAPCVSPPPMLLQAVSLYVEKLCLYNALEPKRENERRELFIKNPALRASTLSPV